MKRETEREEREEMGIERERGGERVERGEQTRGDRVREEKGGDRNIRRGLLLDTSG